MCISVDQLDRQFSINRGKAMFQLQQHRLDFPGGMTFAQPAHHLAGRGNVLQQVHFRYSHEPFALLQPDMQLGDGDPKTARPLSSSW
jgi:hypothetical protein